MPITLNGDTGITTPGLTNTGSTTLVSLTTTGNTILGDQSTDTLNVANGNLVLNSSGNLGIGTASPARRLQVNSGEAVAVRFTRGGGIVANNSLEWFDGTNGWYAGVSGSNFWGVAYNSSGSIDSAAIRLDASGNLGLGVTPSSKLTVASTGSTIELKQNGTGSATYYVMDNTIETGGKRWRFGYSGAAGIPTFSLFNQTDNLVSWVADASGNLGIGTASPAARLDVVSSSYPNFITNRSLSTGGSGSNAWTAAQLKVTTTEQMSAGFGVQQEFVLRDADAVDNIVAAFVVLRDGADNSGALSFRTAAAGTLTERARITSAGNVGIGTTSPATKLEVSNGAITAGDVGTVLVGRYSSSFPSPGAGYFSLSTNNSDGNNGGLSINTLASGTLSERVRVDQNGRLGIGVTSPQTRLDIAGALRFTPNTADTNYSADIFANYDSGHPFQINVKNNGSTAEYMGVYADGGGANNRVVFPTGNVGIGTTSPVKKLDVVGTIRSNTASASLELVSSNAGGNSISFLNSTTYEAYISSISGGGILFGTGASATERVRIDSSGIFYIGKTANTSGVVGWALGGNGTATGTFTQVGTNEIFVWNNTVTNGTAVIDFRTANTTKGNIQWNNTNTSYNTTSDYRLKENVQPMTGALAKVASLKPCTYTWKDGGKPSQGFIAHELGEVVPECVTGEKDAVDENGAIKPQSIDTSFLVATLTAAIQELKSELDSVKTELAALKGN